MAKAAKKTATDVERLEEEAGRWEIEAAARQAELQDLLGRVGHEVLDGSDPDGLARQIAELRAKRDTADATVAEAHRRLEDARVAELRAEAAQLRQRAAARAAEAERRQASAAQLRDELGDVETEAAKAQREAADLEGRALVLAAAADAQRVIVDLDLVDGQPRWDTARISDAGDDASIWAARMREACSVTSLPV